MKEAKKPVEMTPDDLADEEWGPAKAKGKKGKKGKAAKGKAQADEDETEEPGGFPPPYHQPSTLSHQYRVTCSCCR